MNVYDVNEINVMEYTLHERERAATYNQLLAVWREALCSSIYRWLGLCL